MNERVPGTVISHYRILERLGAGGMGEVYLAEDTKLDRKVAIKFLRPDSYTDEQAQRRIVREAKAAAKLDHPNICSIYEVSEEDGTSFIVMQYVEGESLDVRIKRKPLEVGETLDIAIQVAAALTQAHSRGIIHRDIKPQNIIIAAENQVRVVDFGLAKQLHERSLLDSDAETESLLTTPGLLLGTVPYMSPEQVRGETLDARSDIFSFAVVLYEMLSGHRPFELESAAETMSAILAKEPLPLARYSRELHPELERIIRKCLEKNRQRRYQSMSDVAIDLENLQRERAGAARVTLPSEESNTASASAGVTGQAVKRPASLASRRALVFYLAALLAVAAIVYKMLLSEPSARPWPKNEATPQRITLAVLPFRTLNAPGEIGFLSIGIPDAVITRLANAQQLRLRPTSAILRYENQDIEPSKVGLELASDYVATGTVLLAGERLRVSVQLVRTGDGSPIWGQSYDKTRSDLLGLQDDIARQVADALKIKMTATEQQRFYRRYTNNVAAYESYLQGRSRLVRQTEQGTRAAIQAFEDALKLDPNYALAYAGLAIAAGQMRIRFAGEQDVNAWEERAKRDADRALRLDPNLAEAHEALAAVYRYSEFDWARTIEESRRALELNSNLDLPYHYCAVSFYHLGLLELVEREVRAGEEVNPANRVDPLRARGITLLFGANFVDALPLLEEVRRLSPGSVSDLYLAQAYYYKGEHARAEAMLTQVHGSAQADRRAQSTLASFLAARGQTARAQALLGKVVDGTYMDHHVAYSIGAAYAQLGDHVKALDWLRKAVKTGFPCYPWYERDPLLQPLRVDSEFKSLLAELRESWELANAKYGP